MMFQAIYGYLACTNLTITYNHIEAIEQEWHGVLRCIQVLKLWQPARHLANTQRVLEYPCRDFDSGLTIPAGVLHPANGKKFRYGMVELPWTSIFWLHPKMVETAQTIQTVTIMIYCWLVVYLPLWKILEFVSWDYDIPNCETGKSDQIPWFQSPPTRYDILFIMVKLYIYISY